MTADKEEAIASIPRLTRSDLPRAFDRITHISRNGVIAAPMVSGGIVYTDLVFDISDFNYEDLDVVNVLARLFSMCGAAGMSYPEVSTALRFVSGGYAFYVVHDPQEAEPVRKCRLKSLPELQWEGLDLFMKILLEGDIQDEVRIKAALTDISTDFSSSVVQNGHTYASSLASSAFSPSLYIGERLSGVTCWYKIREMLDSDLAELGRRLSQVRSKMIGKERMMIHVTTDDDLMESAVDTASLFITRIPSSLPLMKAEHEVPSLPKYVARTLSSSVSFIALSAIAPGIMDFLSSSERIFLSILSQTSLWARIREKGGAYGAGAYLDYTERIMNFYSYRDPRLESTISDFLTSPESVNVSDENLEDAVIGILARDLRPMSPAVRSLVDIRRMLYRISDSDRERKKNEVLSLTKKDVEKGGEAIAENLRNGAYRIAVIGDRKALESSSLNWEMESLPG